MRRAERLFQILNLLRNRRLVITAEQLADRLDTSKRTIYRDIQSLILTGVPIEGEAGVGYRLARNFDLPPLMFDLREIEALLLGAKMVRAWSDREMAAAANSALQKILAVTPPQLREAEQDFSIYVPEFGWNQKVSSHSEIIRPAIHQKQILDIEYTRADGEQSARRIHPLGLFFWGSVWTLVAWCELRQDYRSFRLDRINQLSVSDLLFELLPTKNMEHYLARIDDCQD